MRVARASATKPNSRVSCYKACETSQVAQMRGARRPADAGVQNSTSRRPAERNEAEIRECRVTRRVRLRRWLRCEARDGRPTQAYKTVRRGGRPSATKQMSQLRSRTSP